MQQPYVTECTFAGKASAFTKMQKSQRLAEVSRLGEPLDQDTCSHVPLEGTCDTCLVWTSRPGGSPGCHMASKGDPAYGIARNPI